MLTICHCLLKMYKILHRYLKVQDQLKILVVNDYNWCPQKAI